MKKDQKKKQRAAALMLMHFFSIPALRLKQRQTLKMIVVGVACVYATPPAKRT